MNKNTKARIEALNEYGAQKEQIEKAAEEARNKKLEDYAEKVLALKPRIDDLIEVANACVENGVSLQPAEVTQRYENGYFISNKQNNLTGFIYREKEGIRLVGIEDAIMTNGDYVTTFVKDCDKECVLKLFLNEFDKFETKFYEFVDEMCANVQKARVASLGATYNISFDIKFKDKDGAAKALYKYVTEDLLVRNPKCFGEEAEPNETIERLLHLLFTPKQNSKQRCYDHRNYEDGWEWYRSEFRAAHSWLDVLDDAFNVIAPYLDDYSDYFRECDEDKEIYRTFDGKPVRVYSTYREFHFI